MTATATTNERAADRRESMFAADFDALAVDDVYMTAPIPIDTRDVDVFAALTGDRHPIHVDAEWARTGPFGRPIAHGLLVLSCAAGTLPLDPDRVVALRRLRDVVFKRPVAVGEAVVVSCRVQSLRPLDDASGLVECEWRIAGEDGRLHVRALVEILWRRGAVEQASEGPTRGAEERDELAPVMVWPDGAVQVLL